MRVIIALLLIGTAFSLNNDLHQVCPMASENATVTKDDDMLGICWGDSTTWEQYPYTVALRYTTGGACCSGSIIQMNPGVILTAAHCNGCTGNIQVGCNNPSNCAGSDEYHFASSDFIQHPSYGSPLQFSHDIAVILLPEVIDPSRGARAIEIPFVEPDVGVVRVVGYGIDQTGGIPSQLQTMESNLIPQLQCNDIMSSALGGGSYVDNTMICIRAGNAGVDGVPTMCSGDSGGPISSGNNVYGVNSWVLQGSGQGCNSCNCCPGYPQVAGNVANMAAWINGYLLPSKGTNETIAS